MTPLIDSKHTARLLGGAALALLFCGAGCAPVEANVFEPDADADTDADTDVDTGSIEGSCEYAPELHAGNAGSFPMGAPAETYLVCSPMPSHRTCTSLYDLEPWDFLREQLGETSDPEACDWYGGKVCGPDKTYPDRCCYVLNVRIQCNED